MKAVLFAGIIGAVMINTAMAGGIQGGNVACVSKKALDQFTKFAVNDDQEAMKGLMGTSCIPTDMLAEFEAKTIDRGVAVSKVRVSLQDGPMTLYVSSEAAPD